MSPHLAWIATEKIRAGYNYNASPDHSRIAKACGMNTIFSRLEIANDPGGDVALLDTLAPAALQPEALVSYELVEPLSRLAKELGLHWFFMLNLAASAGNYEDGVRENSRRFNNGKLPAPTDEIYWTRVVENRFLRVAELLRSDTFQIDGFLIDPKMYILDGATPPGMDVGDYALGQFLAAEGRTVDFKRMSIRARQEWVADEGLEEKLRCSQFDRIKALAQRTRERVQDVHPDAVFGFFLWRPGLWFSAVAAGFSTPRTPCLIGPESTYSGDYSEDFLAYQDAVRAAAHVPILFVPGLALSGGDSPDRLNALGANLYHRTIRSQGYWFWSLSRAFGTPESRGPVVDMLTRVNAELDAYLRSDGQYESSLKPCPLPADAPAHLQDTLIDTRSWISLPGETMPIRPPPATAMQLRGLNTFVFRAESGTTVSFDVGNVRLGRYLSPTQVKAFRPDRSEAMVETIPLSEERTVTVQADVSGSWVLAVSSGRTVGNAFRMTAEAPGVVLYAPDGWVAGCAGGQEVFRYFFYVPKGTGRFRLKMSGSGKETASFRLFGPEGQNLIEELGLSATVEREIDAGTLAGRVCWIEITDMVEDHGFGLVGIPNIFAWRPQQLLAPKE